MLNEDALDGGHHFLPRSIICENNPLIAKSLIPGLLKQIQALCEKFAVIICFKFIY
ncbi:hypothetical protein [Thalassorhabdomicrobium marinisediminis]|uniref:hypothetical protein n=1 Tax=Thalassorhabdomicrobium marinisediminis TaxID=2170577 RepID=UPI001304B99C|nr:hypothetical protein [Thalassorhabdomicrobium marinisediminis]